MVEKVMFCSQTSEMKILLNLYVPPEPENQISRGWSPCVILSVCLYASLKSA